MTTPLNVAAQVTRVVPTQTHDDPEVDGEDAIIVVTDELNRLLPKLRNSSHDIEGVEGLGTGQVTVVTKIWFDFLSPSWEDRDIFTVEALEKTLPGYDVIWCDSDHDDVAEADLAYQALVERWEQQQQQ